MLDINKTTELNNTIIDINNNKIEKIKNNKIIDLNNTIIDIKNKIEEIIKKWII